MPDRPHILFILTDQQRWDTLDCYGSPIWPGLTPHLDRLAAEGVRFNHCFTPQPLCGPARACLQTGMYATQVGCHVNNRSLPPDQPTVAGLLGDHGYETAFVGKWHLASDPAADFKKKAVPPDRRGGYRDHWMASDALEFTSHGYEGYFHDTEGRRIDWEGYRVVRTVDFAIDYLRDYARRGPENPFFLFLSILEPHQQNDLDRFIGPIGSKERFRAFRTPGDLEGCEGNWPSQMPDYLGCCASIDASLADLREALESLGLADDTLIIYTSDHGCHFRTRNAEYKRCCHEASIRIPLILHGPGFRGGDVYDELVSLLDLPPTVLRAAGIEPAAAMAGSPLQHLADGGEHWRQDVLIQISESQIGRALRTPRWKYSIRAPEEGFTWFDPPAAVTEYVEDCLYDLHADPHERNNLVRDPALSEARQELARVLRERLAAIGERVKILPAAD